MTTTNPDEVVRALRDKASQIDRHGAECAGAAAANVLRQAADLIESLTAKPVDEAGRAEIEVALDEIEGGVRHPLSVGFVHSPLSKQEYQEYHERVVQAATVIRLAMRRVSAPIPAPDRGAVIEAAQNLVDNAPVGDDDEPYCSDIMQHEFKALVRALKTLPTPPAQDNGQ